MNHRLSLLSAAIAASVICTVSANSAMAADFRTVENPVVGQYIVVLKDSAAALANENSRRPKMPVAARAIAADHGARAVRIYEHVLRGFAASADDAALARLLADPRVDYVEEDGHVSIDVTQSNATWGLDRIDQRNLPLSGTYTYDTSASGTHSYIIDTGMRASHNEFTGRVGNGFTSIIDGNGTNDCHGHGTHVAGTVGGTTYGVAKSTTLHPVRVLNCAGSGTWSEVISGMDWVRVNHVKPAVANMSLGGGTNASVNTAVANLTNAGVTVVVAAGNNTADACGFSPAGAASAITVGSTVSNDARSSFSNFGSCLDIFAPGSQITSAWNTSNTAINTIDGTSMASPHVAGAAALYLAVNPTASVSEVTNALINASTLNKVTNPGTGSPNRLLYSLFSSGGGSVPVINIFRCPDLANSGGNTYSCIVTYTSGTPATVAWTNTAGQVVSTFDELWGTCSTGSSLRFTATVSNAAGSVSRTSSLFSCPTGPIP